MSSAALLVPDISEGIEEFASRLVISAKTFGVAQGRFNGVWLYTDGDLSVDYLVGFYRGYLQAQSQDDRGGLRPGY